MLRAQTRGPLPGGLPYDPAFFRPTGGGIGASSVIGNTDYSHFPQMELGARQRLHEFNYEGPEHGQDSDEAVCLRQLGFAGVDLTIDGTFATGGVAYIPSITRIVIDSVYDISDVTFTVYGFDELGSPQTETITGPDDGRTTGTLYFADRITRVSCSGNTAGMLSVGFQVTPGKMAYRYSDNFGRNWSTPNYLVDGNDNRGYRPALMSYASGIVVALYFKLDIPLYETGNFRRVSYDNGVTWGPEEEVTFTGLDTGDTVVFHSRWRQLGDINGAEVQVSVGASGNRSYTLRTSDYGATIASIKFAEVDHGADNDLIYEIDSINDGTNTVTLKSSHGDVTAYWPANMASTITGTGGANGNSYVISSSFGAGQTSIVLNELAAGTVSASSKIKRLYGPRQVLDVDTGTNTIRIEGDQTANIIAGSGHYMGFNGFSSGGVGYLDGVVAGATSVTYEAGTPGRTAIVLSEPIPTGTIARPFSRLSDVQLGEWGIGCLTDLNWTLVPRTNAMPSALPRFVTNDGGTTVSLVGATPTVEGSYVALEVDFVPTDHGIMELITCYARSTTDKFFAVSCDALLARTSSDYFCPPWYFLSIPDDYNNSGYHSIVFPNGDGFGVMAYGKEKTESTAEVLCRVVDFGPVLSDVTYASRAPTASDDITAGFVPGRRWALYDGSDLYTAISTVEDEASWLSAIPGPKLKSGQYYGNSLAGAVATQAITENRLHFVLVEAPGRRISVQALAVYVRSATSMTGAEQFKMAVYDDDEGTPGAKLWDAGTGTFTGSAGNQRLEVEETVGPGRFWIAFIANLNGGGAMPGLPSSASGGYGQGIIGYTGGNYASFVRYVYSDQTIPSWAAYTLPDPAPAVTYNDSTGNAIQLVFQVE